MLESGRAGLVANTQWQAGLFGFAKERTIIPPMLEPMPKVKKQRGLFVFASGAMKGFEATVAMTGTPSSFRNTSGETRMPRRPPPLRP
jgi:hypothetical protein